ncbi:MAG: Glycosyl transferase group 1 [Microgenomates bacterium 39_7]|nr:MAG: Glycosyl transferase group 1 [Microgenomates bacterium 39_7]
MNIGIDITSLIYQRGVSRYTSNLVRALDRYSKEKLFLYGYSFSQKKFLEEQAAKLTHHPQSKHQFKIQRIPVSVQSKLWQLSLNKVTTNFPNLDLFHSWDWLQPPDDTIPIVSTIHDLAILKFPQTAHPKVLKAHQKSWEILKKRKAHIIAVSHATKKDIVENLDIPNWRVHVVPESLPTEIEQIDREMTEEAEERIISMLNLDRPYILFVGVREPRKNLDRLIEAWLPLAKEIDLIVVGEKSWSESSQKPHPNLRFLGRVTDQELSVLYAQAQLFAYPSLYEGFGLPILEAFHHGTPVITSDISAMIEVAGNAAELVNPTSVGQITEAIKKILNETKTEQQHRLQRMIIRKQMFNWNKVARQTLAVYQKAVEDFNS